MEMNNFFRGDSHVAQQSRRDKLRVQNSENLEHFYPNSLEQFSVIHHPDLVQLRNIKYGTLPYDPPMFSSNMVNYVSKNSQVLLPQNESLVSADNVSGANLSHPISSNLSVSSAIKMSVNDPHNCSNRKNIGSQQNCDWIVNNYHNNNPTTITESARNPLFSGGEGSGLLKINNVSASSLYMKQPNSYGYNDMVHSSLVVRPSGEMQLSGSLYNYQNSLQEVVTSANVGHQGQHMVRYGGKNSNELRLLPSYSDHQSSQALACNGSAVWVNRPVEVFRDWDSQGHGNKSDGQQMAIGDGSNTQGLSLSLSSVPTSKTSEWQFGERNGLSDPAELNALKSEYLCSNSRQSVGSKKFYGINCQNSAGTSTIPHRDAAGPLGPFTGYATILKNSKYLKPTLQLMDDLFRGTGTKQIETGDGCSVKNSDETAISAEHSINPAGENMVGAKGVDSGASSSTFYSSNGISREAGAGVRSDASECYQHDYHQKKTKLLYMQEELCRRYRQYHQQMQMVVASFESVAGLSAAAPYISVALKSVSRHFRCLKHAISEQLKHMGRKLGEEFSSPTAGTSSTTGRDQSNFGSRLIEHQKQQSCGGNMIFFEPQQPVWRPQRGLPERAVAVLRAWLFDHFLHPYPTDTDKHMLATQTGLTRNQVSNWFINARVRVWKPMVEEIHVLETKGLAESSSQAGKADRNSASENASNLQYLPGTDCLRGRDMAGAEIWNQEKRSRRECHIPANMDDGSLMSVLPYQRGGLEIGGGLGAVSLTLGLRQSAESAHQQQQDHYRQHFGDHMIHDFVG